MTFPALTFRTFCWPLPITREKPISGFLPEDKLDPGELCGRIALDHISFRYEADGPLVLDDVSPRIEPREFVGTYSVPS